MEGIEKPIVNHGFIAAPERPGLGVTLNDEVVNQHLLEPGYFDPTTGWNKESVPTAFGVEKPKVPRKTRPGEYGQNFGPRASARTSYRPMR